MTGAPRREICCPRYACFVAEPNLRTNPDALADGAAPCIGRHAVNGTNLYAEVRGSGPTVLLIGASDEDAEVYRPIAERLPNRTVVTYDRRGTLRSGRENWPGGGSLLHADDAAGLLSALGLEDAVVFAASAGGIVGLRLALRHPEMVHRALIYEPGYFRHVPGGEEMQRRVYAAVAEHLSAHPEDWAGASAALGRAITSTIDPESRGFFEPPRGKEWYAERGDINAEALIREDLTLTAERVTTAELESATVDIRFAFGTSSVPIFREIVEHLSAIRGETPDSIHGVGHAVYYLPDAIAAYILAHSRPRSENSLDATDED